jgi:hypothetical protein
MSFIRETGVEIVSARSARRIFNRPLSRVLLQGFDFAPLG